MQHASVFPPSAFYHALKSDAQWTPGELMEADLMYRAAQGILAFKNNPFDWKASA